MDIRLEGSVALVTGASRGIGLEVVRSLSGSGATVVGAARTVTDELAGLASGVACDLTDPAAPAALVEQTVREHGGLDVLVNNVGAFEARTEGFAGVDDAAWQRTFELNLFSVVRTIRAALPHLVERGGRLITISSANARMPQPPVVDYAAAKAAVTNLGSTLAQELGPQGVQVTTISPGPTRTSAWTSPDGFGASLAEASGVDLDTFLEQFPEQSGLTTGRMTEPTEVAALVTLVAAGAVPNAHGVDLQLHGGQNTSS